MASTVTLLLPRVDRVTIRNSEWGYAILQMIFEPPYTDSSLSHPDILTWRTALSTALKQYLGLFGSAMHIDILHLHDDEATIRFPRTELTKFSAAVSGFMGAVDGKAFGFKTVAMGEFLMGLLGRREEVDLWAE
ncbi:hypothetical protein EX30DRAFT_371391 [Ascodesmis nigricans]|uniref:Ribonucleases P/MRP subunit Pop8-like domain-containing protein n=1 Tax=Ascodesmis nigricans TaxID=341454 RepID=A0A4S2MXG4_9PEZI|nr:hypothetical protein EX30DRAFT_371391 [Ascodesmis nigricans]